MDTQHTPGPWAVSEIGITNDGGKPVTFGDIESDYYGRVCLVTMRSDAKRGEAWRTPCPVRDANALLIAAAPDLLAAAKRSLEGWDNAIELAIILPQHRNTATILADELRAAIAKATGKQEG